MGSRVALLLAIGILTLAFVLDFGRPSTDRITGDVKSRALSATIARNRVVSDARESMSSQSDARELASQIGSNYQVPPVVFRDFRRGPDIALRTEPSTRMEWLNATDSIETILAKAEQTGRDWVFGWIQVAPGSDRDQLRVDLMANKVQPIGFDGEFVRVRLPNLADEIEAVTEHSSIVGIGVQPSSGKISKQLASRMNSSADEIPVLISLIEEDQNGLWQSDLESFGVVVGDWLPFARAYSANATSEEILTIASADYVTLIEPIEFFQVMLDTAVPVMGADGLRVFNESTHSFTGTTGESVAVGVIDTGLNIAHEDINSHRKSICGENFYPDNDGDGRLDLWSDFRGHGTHVTGIIAGNGSVKSEFAGIAPLIRHIRIAKVLNRDGSGDSVTVANGVRYLLGKTGCEWLGTQSEEVKPLVLNMSLGGPGERDGRGATNRNIDAVISHGSQLLVLAAGNEGVGGTSNESTAKNVLAVGAVTDSGVVNSFSSHGPTADGRLNPHVVGTGSAIVSTKGNSSSNSYVRYRGTSMAAPSVAGVAALLMDANPEFRNAPAYTKARLMASAIKPARTLGIDDFPLTNSDGPGAFNAEYGLGLVSASVVTDNRSDHWLHGGDSGTIKSGESYEFDLIVEDNTARLDIVLTWMEPPNAAIAPSTIVADLDLYLDKGGDCEGVTCGEYSSTSRIDNVEWIVVKEPSAGTYRLKIVASNDFAGSVNTGIAWTAIADNDTPTLAVSAEDEALLVESGTGFEINLNLSADAFLSAGTTLHVVCKSESTTGCDGYENAHWHPSSHVRRRDTLERVVDTPVGVSIPIGEIRFGDTQTISLAVPRGIATENHTLYFVATSWNALAGTAAVKVLPEEGDSVVQAARLPNDSMASAAEIVGDAGEIPIHLLLATREPGEPVLQEEVVDSGVKKFFYDARVDQASYDEEMQSYARQGSVWFSIEAERSGPYRINTLPTSLSRNTWLAVYDGTVARVSNRLTVGEGIVEFNAKSGADYLVQVWTSDPVRPSLRLVWNQFAERQPENDDFEDRITLSGSRGVVAGTNYRATLESFEYFGVKSQGASTWFRWIAPESRRFEFEVSDGLSVFVFDGTNTGSLRRVSTMPVSYLDTQFEAEVNREYQIVVLDSAERLVPDYELSWQPASSFLISGFADNDMRRNASTIEGATGDESVVAYRSRTVESTEDVRTGVGTGWWRWRTPVAGMYSFQVNGDGFSKLAIFTGTSPDDLEYVTDGEVLSFDAEADRQYWISLGFRRDSMFADVDGHSLASSFMWGPLPENDVFTAANGLTGTTGTITADHSFATSSPDQLGHIRGHASLWWKWVAPSTGWQRFALQEWRAAGLDDASQQGILAVYQQSGASAPDLIATSDHSYIANGRAEAIIRAEEGNEYLLRVALRSTDLGDWNRELTFSYEPVDVPAWQRYAGRIAEVGRRDVDVIDAALFEPSSIAAIGDLGLIVVATSDGLVSYAEEANGVLSSEENVSYVDEVGAQVDIDEGAALHWDANGDALYLIQRDGIFEISEPLSSASRLSDCTSGKLDGVVPDQVVMDSESKNMYVVGDGGINVYTVEQDCEIEPLQNVGSRFSSRTNVPFLRLRGLSGARSIALSRNDEHIYAASNEGLISFLRVDNGSLTHESTLPLHEWAPGGYLDFRTSSVVFGSDDVLFVMGHDSPSVAAFDISAKMEGEDPVFLGLIKAFHISENDYRRDPFYSHIAQPRESQGCRAFVPYEHSEATASVDVFCNNQVYTVQWDNRKEQLFISDWIQIDQADRFGRLLRDGIHSLSPKKVAESVRGNRNYVLGASLIGTLHIFDRASRLTESPYTE